MKYCPYKLNLDGASRILGRSLCIAENKRKMNILSYRGPGKAGGVSGALARIVDGTSDRLIRWWYLNENGLASKTGREDLQHVKAIPRNIVEGHYRHCNNFLWPVLHDMPERAIYSPGDRQSYRLFNQLFALNILQAKDKSDHNYFFVQDYQLALQPPSLAYGINSVVNTFWHIPWPHFVERAHLKPLVEIAEALLDSNKLGFHIDEYALNFMNFVRLHLPQYEVDFDTRQIVPIKTKLLNSDRLVFSQVVVCPLGLDWDFWRQNANLEETVGLGSTIIEACSKPYILSVDRADYSKGILQRIAAIDHLFEEKPSLIGKITFVQVCQPSRIGLIQFDRYWRQLQKALHDLNSRWQKPGWQPLVWEAEPVAPADLAWLYKNATAMLVSPIRDGLNLTAKEFVACSNKDDGLLLLSAGAGVWQEIGDMAITIDAHAPIVAAQQIARSLSIAKPERIRRMAGLKARIKANPLEVWWRNFTSCNTQIGITSTIASVRQKFGLEGTSLSDGEEMKVPTIFKE